MDNDSDGNGIGFWKRGKHYVMTNGDIKKLISSEQLAYQFNVSIEALERHPVGEITEDSLCAQTKKLENALPDGVYRKKDDRIFIRGDSNKRGVSYKEVASAYGVDPCVIRGLPSCLITEDKVIETMLALDK
jgi:hypothetical protein